MFIHNKNEKCPNKLHLNVICLYLLHAQILGNKIGIKHDINKTLEVSLL